MGEEKMLDIESQHIKTKNKQKQQSPVIRFLKSDLFLIISLITSVSLLCFLLSSTFLFSSSTIVSSTEESKKSIPVTNKNTLESNKKIDPDQELLRDIIRERQKNILQNQQQDVILDLNFDANEEYKTIVALSPVIIISWDDDLINIPVSTQPTEEQIVEQNNLKPESDFEISKNFKNLMLRNYQILPQPAVLSINKHPNRVALINHIMKKVENLGISKKSNFLPGLIINGRPVASAKAIENLHSNGKLLEYLKSWGDGVISVDKV